MKKFILLLTLLVVGCSTVPMPHCDVVVKGKCREMSPSEQNGAGTRGHTESKDIP